MEHERTKYFTNPMQRIKHSETFELGTKAAPILSDKDQRCLKGVPSIEETNDGQEKEPST